VLAGGGSLHRSRAVRNFIAHDYAGTDQEILWAAMAVEFPRIAEALAK
jgi:uncharacterized protein with HEPN domain